MSYEEQDFQSVFLFHKLGGVAVAELAHRTFGLPSIGTTRRHIVTQPLVASPKIPTIAEMTQNLEYAFPKPEVSAIPSNRQMSGRISDDGQRDQDRGHVRVGMHV